MACFTFGGGEAITVRVRVVLTVHKPTTAVSSTTRTRLTSLSQGGSRNCRGQSRACQSACNATYRGTASDLFISHRFADVFKPISHRHLLSKRSDTLCLTVGFCPLQNPLHQDKNTKGSLRELQNAWRCAENGRFR